MRITITLSLRRCCHRFWVARYEADRLRQRHLHRPRHAASRANWTRARLTLSFRDAATLDWLRNLKTAEADRVTAEALVAQYMARMAVIASRGPLGMRGALIAACDLTDRLAAAVYAARARQPNPWAQAGARTAPAMTLSPYFTRSPRNPIAR